MVNKNLIGAIDSGSEQKCGVAVYFSFLHGMDQCFDAIFECAEGCGKDKAMTVIKKAYDMAKADAELELRETLFYLANRGKGYEK